MCVTPSSTAVRRTAIAWSRSLGGPKTPGPASCIAPYPILVMVRSSARVMVEFVMSPLFVADGRTGSAPLFLVVTGPSLPGHARSTVVVMESTNALGDYLRARREQVRPEDVGIRSIGLRRVPGLRREEVAMLAGISSDYYLRLEQGRDRNPSAQVLDALAEVLRLDADATAYLRGLAQERPAPRRTGEKVPESILELIEGLPNNPAYVQNKYTDCLAVNPLCVALPELQGRGQPAQSSTARSPAASAPRRVRRPDRGGRRDPPHGA